MSLDLQEIYYSLSAPPELYKECLTLNTQFTNLLSQLQSASSTIKTISGPVSSLESQRHNTRVAISHVEEICQYSFKLKELISAIKFDNIPYAAHLCGELSKIPHRLHDAHTFHRLKEEVSEKVKHKFGEALSQNNKETIEQYAGLFHHLELGREGIERYIQYIIENLKAQFSGIEGLLEGGGNYEDILVKAYRSTVRMFEGQQENIVKEFGDEGCLELLQDLQRAVDVFAVRMIDKYSSGISAKKDTRSICEEMAKIIKHSESFEIYLHKLGKGLRAKSSAKLTEGFSNETGLLKLSDLKSKILELANVYISLESQYIQESISTLLSKISISQYTEKNFSSKDPLTSGLAFERLDECFFILQNTITRVLSTLNLNSICAILNNTATLLCEILIESLSKKSPQSKLQFSPSFTQPVANFIVFFNLMNTCKKCIKKLVTNLSQQFSKIFGGEGSDSIMFKQCLEAIGEAGGRAKAIVEEYVEICGKSFVPVQLLGGFRALGYDLTLDQHADYEVNDPFALKLVRDIKALVKQWKMQMDPEVFEMLVEFIADELAKAIEAEVKSKRFNELGALQFQKDVREVTGQIQQLSTRPLRARFSKLKQICELLLAKDEIEVGMLMKDSEWKLSDRETTGYRRLRIN